MKNKSYILLLAVMFLPMGCAIKQAQNPQEFREIAPDNSYGEHKTYTINNSYSRAVNNFKMRAEKCMSKEVVVTTVSKTGAKMGEYVWTYTPTLVVGDSKSELSVQRNVRGSATILGKTPEKGMYIFLADISKSGNNTKLDIYRLTYRGTNELVSAVKNWASGKSLDCPDLAK